MKKTNRSSGVRMGLGAAAGTILALLLGLFISMFTGDVTFWAWLIPLGASIGTGIGLLIPTHPKNYDDYS